MTTWEATKTFCSRVQRRPTRAPGIRWLKCQTWVDSPREDGESTQAVGWMKAADMVVARSSTFEAGEGGEVQRRGLFQRDEVARIGDLDLAVVPVEVRRIEAPVRALRGVERGDRLAQAG